MRSSKKRGFALLDTLILPLKDYIAISNDSIISFKSSLKENYAY
ncbi:hypothetical protein MEI_00494 [Bartonella vinsonii subsp. arupensis Pm136co]|uniref:Uncharacterized protein n=1 Tax=Bartonella vinsonii subsp. arupensis Pm136co TaxID=1094561 RepID=A0ABN0GQS7_BARVI|nr:hypothetical protein MEI_00494 [Bartonella vinsonii subsp. arupensis Pm136co]